MSRGAHAARKTPGPAAQAARKALVRSSAFTGALAVAWTMVGVLEGQGHLDAFAADEESAESAPAAPSDPLNRKIEALHEKYRCSSTGLDDGVIPARSVVRVDGEVRLATFDEGWAMHLGDVPGTLVSVCAR